jgi:hypothetical protein
MEVNDDRYRELQMALIERIGIDAANKLIIDALLNGGTCAQNR